MRSTILHVIDALRAIFAPSSAKRLSALNSRRCTRNIARTAAAAAVLLLPALGARAAECPNVPPAHLPKLSSPLNLDIVKTALREYHKDKYSKDMAAVFSVARRYVERRAPKVKNPAVVLDIDETSLSNWKSLDLDDFGFIKNGSCSERSGFACGFGTWVAKGTAPAIPSALAFYRAVRARQIAVFFITGRLDSQRDITVRNLHRVGYREWTKLVTRPNNDKRKSIVPFKSGERAQIVKHGYDILATIGDQDSDLSGGFADCGFKLSNPFYFIQ
jgi:acid phosphatase